MNNVLAARQEIFARIDGERERLMDKLNCTENERKCLLHGSGILSPNEGNGVTEVSGRLTAKTSEIYKDAMEEYGVRIYESKIPEMLLDGFVNGELSTVNLNPKTSDPYQVIIEKRIFYKTGTEVIKA